ncbi:hypothetical protein, partial [Enterobacter hormaechei]|uniref:hypothetical protein n=1 Tax=Enterobacter hormaechei TaxID=158836 RepID=UPI001F45676E
NRSLQSSILFPLNHLTFFSKYTEETSLLKQPIGLFFSQPIPKQKKDQRINSLVLRPNTPVFHAG